MGKNKEPRMAEKAFRMRSTSRKIKYVSLAEHGYNRTTEKWKN